VAGAAGAGAAAAAASIAAIVANGGLHLWVLVGSALAGLLVVFAMVSPAWQPVALGVCVRVCVICSECALHGLRGVLLHRCCTALCTRVLYSALTPADATQVFMPRERKQKGGGGGRSKRIKVN
jgi:hypothetical protein